MSLAVQAAQFSSVCFGMPSRLAVAAATWPPLASLTASSLYFSVYSERWSSNCRQLDRFFDVDPRSKALGDKLPSFECSLMLL